ncbi:MAG: hypothetical protein PHP54_04540 [Clostridia bacterium]|nr:hypothetical protein [Clostridia bacterium]
MFLKCDNIENTNAELINEGLSQQYRLIKLNESAKSQIAILEKNKGIKELENLQEKVRTGELLKLKEIN